MKLDIVLPAYNEEAIITDSVAEIIKKLTPFHVSYRIVVANNGSTDSTSEYARAAGADVIEVPGKGKGRALAYAALYSEAEYLLFIDADLSASPSEIQTLWSIQETEGADIVIGSRLLKKTLVKRSLLRTLSSEVFNLLRSLILGIHVTDTQCGLKLMNEKGRMVLAECEETGWFIDMEFLARAEQKGLLIKEVPISWEEFRFPNRESKLNLLADGVQAIEAMFRIRSRLKQYGKESL